jgi:hypothetical protein
VSMKWYLEISIKKMFTINKKLLYFLNSKCIWIMPLNSLKQIKFQYT